MGFVTGAPGKILRIEEGGVGIEVMLTVAVTCNHAAGLKSSVWAGRCCLSSQNTPKCEGG